jgi:ankyrin repeat protein
MLLNCSEMVSELLNCGFEINAADEDGYTPLHYAVRGCRYTFVLSHIPFICGSCRFSIHPKRLRLKLPIHYCATALWPRYRASLSLLVVYFVVSLFVVYFALFRSRKPALCGAHRSDRKGVTPVDLADRIGAKEVAATIRTNVFIATNNCGAGCGTTFCKSGLDL